MSPSPRSNPNVEEITPELLRRWPLPQPDHEGDKEERGRVLVVGGETEAPGGVLLAATAALRAGVGKLQIGACASLVIALGMAIPEARVFSLPELDEGGIAPEAAEVLAARARQAQAALFGPGVINQHAATALLLRLLPHVTTQTVVLDAGALHVLREHPRAVAHLQGRAVLTPHAGEMASLTGEEKEAVCADTLRFARAAAKQWDAVVALKGAETCIADPEGRVFINRAGNVGLATSGSGDVLSGIIAGLAARGAEPLQAAVWGVYLHARAGDLLAEQIGPIGYLARELLAEVPRLLHHLSTPAPAEQETL